MAEQKIQLAIVLHPVLKDARAKQRSAENELTEILGLSCAIGLDIVHHEILRVQEMRPATYIGSGQVDRVAETAATSKAGLVIVNASLTPVQQRNLERAWQTKVIDRTGLILEIFGERARTREGQLQVELAALTYQRSRLVRSWTHLERQRGGAGFLGGPGESQLEIDRRLIDEKVQRLKNDLADVKRTRALHRKARSRVPYPIVALVGYTNAGKSTLFNRLTKSDVLAKDMLFATLDPTMRRMKLPSGRDIILSDTVGFISDLPTELIAAFRATLEEVIEADVIVHVRDIAHPETLSQKADVEKVLRELGTNGANRPSQQPMIEVLNKIDLLNDFSLPQPDQNREPTVALSAVTGQGLDQLLHLIDKQMSAMHETLTLQLDHDEGKTLSWLYQHGEIIERKDMPQKIEVTVRISAGDLEHFKARRLAAN